MSAANMSIHNAETIRIKPSSVDGKYTDGADWYDITVITDNGCEVEITVFGMTGLPNIILEDDNT